MQTLTSMNSQPEYKVGCVCCTEGVQTPSEHSPSEEGEDVFTQFPCTDSGGLPWGLTSLSSLSPDCAV